MTTNNSHRPLRSSWRHEAFTKPKTSKDSVMVNRSIGRRNSSPVAKYNGSFLSSGKQDTY